MANKPKTIKVPDEKSLLVKQGQYASFYSALHAQQKEDDDYYELTFESDVPSIYDERVPPTARDHIDVGVRNFTLDNPKAIFFPRNDSDDAREQVEKLEHFTKSLADGVVDKQELDKQQ